MNCWPSGKYINLRIITYVQSMFILLELLPHFGMAWRWSVCGTAEVVWKPRLLWQWPSAHLHFLGLLFLGSGLVSLLVVFLLLSYSWTTYNVIGVLPGLMRRRTGLCPSGPKSSFQMRASCVFHLETKVLESGGRVEKLIAQVSWSPVLSFHSLWWFGVQCLLVLVHCVY